MGERDDAIFHSAMALKPAYLTMNSRRSLLIRGQPMRSTRIGRLAVSLRHHTRAEQEQLNEAARFSLVHVRRLGRSRHASAWIWPPATESRHTQDPDRRRRLRH